MRDAPPRTAFSMNSDPSTLNALLGKASELCQREIMLQDLWVAVGEIRHPLGPPRAPPDRGPTAPAGRGPAGRFDATDLANPPAEPFDEGPPDLGTRDRHLPLMSGGASRKGILCADDERILFLQ